MIMGRRVCFFDGGTINFHGTKNMPFVYNIVFFVYINELLTGILHIIPWCLVQTNL